jgi:hypothetical protein
MEALLLYHFVDEETEVYGVRTRISVPENTLKAQIEAEKVK